VPVSGATVPGVPVAGMTMAGAAVAQARYRRDDLLALPGGQSVPSMPPEPHSPPESSMPHDAHIPSVPARGTNRVEGDGDRAASSSGDQYRATA
jgi:hypothetical protein